MEKKRYWLWAVGGLVFGLHIGGYGQARLSRADSCREAVVVWARSEVGVREKTGRNDGARIDFYNRTAKVPMRSPYCASFVWTAFVEVGCQATGVQYPAQARQWFRDPKRVVLTQQMLRGNRRMVATPKRGCVVGYYFQKRLNAISHIEILDVIDWDGGWIYCIGANTSARSSATVVDRAGDGVYYVRRRINTFFLITEI